MNKKIISNDEHFEKIYLITAKANRGKGGFFVISLI